MATSKKAGKKGATTLKEREPGPFPASSANTLEDNAKSATEIAAAVDPKGTAEKSGATVNAESMERAGEQLDAQDAQTKKDEDTSIFGRISRSGLFFVRDHVKDQEYVGISPQADPEADASSKSKSAVFGLDTIPPRTGMQVRPKDGDPFVVGDGFGLDARPDDWARVINPKTKKSLFG